MSKEESKVPKHPKLNRMTKAQAKVQMEKCEATGDKGSDYYLAVRKVAFAVGK